MRLAPLCILLALTTLAHADPTYPPRPADRTFILDEADLVSEADEDAIRATCDALLTEKQIPIITVTIDALADYDAHDLTIEQYAHDLFDHWGIGFEDYNYGILLLIARDDRKARIELGADWGRDYDPHCRKIMDRLIIPSFKAGEYSTGIVAGVDGLDRMARGEDIPGSPVGDAVRATRGFIDSAVEWIAGVGMMIVWIPLVILGRIFGWGGGRHRSGWGGGGGFGGGGFGGGSSGGGGASGGW